MKVYELSPRYDARKSFFMKYFETTVSHNSNFDFIDKGYNVKPNITIEELRVYGMNRLNRGEIKGWYVETDNGKVIEKHTHVIY